MEAGPAHQVASHSPGQTQQRRFQSSFCPFLLVLVGMGLVRPRSGWVQGIHSSWINPPARTQHLKNSPSRPPCLTVTNPTTSTHYSPSGRPPQPRFVRLHHPRPPGAFTRSLHSSSARRDVFFVTIPEFKETLLMITRVTLVALPVAWRWGAFRRFPSGARTLIWLPLASFMIVVGLGLQQSPKTARWRLLLMSQ